MKNPKFKMRSQRNAIIIIGEGPTEQYYFSHLKNIFQYKCKIRPRFFCNTCASRLEKSIIDALEGSATVLCVFDEDVSKRNEKENMELKSLKTKYISNPNVIFCPSMPSIEYWFLLHFRDCCPNYSKSDEAERELRKYIKKYEKTETFLKNEKWVKVMSMKDYGLDNACKRAKIHDKPNASYSKIYFAIEKLRKTI